MRNVIFKSLLVVLLAAVSASGCGQAKVEEKSAVNIINKGTYFEVSIDYDVKGRFETGAEYAQKVFDALPDYEKVTDSYLAETAKNLHDIYPDVTYESLLSRSQEVIKQVDAPYKEELDGFASKLSGGNVDVMGDGKLSYAEYCVTCTMPDVSTGDACSNISVYGDRSQTGKNIVARCTDWFVGSGLVCKLSCMVHSKTGGSEIFYSTTLGVLGTACGISNKGLLISNLYSAIGGPYIDKGMHAVLFDVRKALETKATIKDAADFFADPSKEYAYHHMMFLADENRSAVLENDFGKRRALRDEKSELNPGISWPFDNAIACVNAFMLKGNHDNYKSREFNTGRWASYVSGLQAKGKPVSFEGLKEIQTHYTPQKQGKDPGDILNAESLFSMVYSFADKRLEIWFHPPTPDYTENPQFVEVKLPF